MTISFANIAQESSVEVDRWDVSLVAKKIRDPQGKVMCFDPDGLDFCSVEFDAFERDLTSKMRREWGRWHAAINNEMRKCIFVRLFNILKLIDNISPDGDFRLIFDKRTDCIPHVSILLGANLESPKSFLYDTRDTIYPFLRLLFPEKTAGFKGRNGFLLKLKVRSLIIFIVTLLKYVIREASTAIINKRRCVSVPWEDREQAVLVLLRNDAQRRFFETRILANRSFDGVDFILLGTYESDLMSASQFMNICRLRYEMVRRSVAEYARLFFTSCFMRSQFKTAVSLELSSNFEHLLGNQCVEDFFLNSCKGPRSVISFEMVGRHSVFIQELCERTSQRLNRFQVASLVEKHVSNLGFYGQFWAADGHSYKSLSTKFGPHIRFEGDLVPLVQKEDCDVDSRRVLFATQPYGSATNVRIVELLMRHLPLEMRLVIRRHPRDRFDYLREFPGICYDDLDDLTSVFSSRLVVAKTSTILQTCVFYKVPFISAQLDVFSRTVEIPFLRGFEDSVAISSQQLIIKLQQILEIKIDGLISRVPNVPDLEVIRREIEII